MLTKNEITTSIGNIGRAVAATREQIQLVCVSLCGHAFEHGDVTQGSDLLNVCKGIDRQAIVTYLEKFGPFIWDKKTNAFKCNKKMRADAVYDEAYLLHADTPTWYSYVKPKNQLVSAFDLQGRAAGLLTAMDKAQEKGAAVDNAEFASFLRKALGDYNGAKAEALRIVAAAK